MSADRSSAGTRERVVAAATVAAVSGAWIFLEVWKYTDLFGGSPSSAEPGGQEELSNRAIQIPRFRGRTESFDLNTPPHALDEAPVPEATELAQGEARPRALEIQSGSDEEGGGGRTRDGEGKEPDFDDRDRDETVFDPLLQQFLDDNINGFDLEEQELLLAHFRQELRGEDNPVPVEQARLQRGRRLFQRREQRRQRRRLRRREQQRQRREQRRHPRIQRPPPANFSGPRRPHLPLFPAAFRLALFPVVGLVSVWILGSRRFRGAFMQLCPRLYISRLARWGEARRQHQRQQQLQTCRLPSSSMDAFDTGALVERLRVSVPGSKDEQEILEALQSLLRHRIEILLSSKILGPSRPRPIDVEEFVVKMTTRQAVLETWRKTLVEAATAPNVFVRARKVMTLANVLWALGVAGVFTTVGPVGIALAIAVGRTGFFKRLKRNFEWLADDINWLKDVACSSANRAFQHGVYEVFIHAALISLQVQALEGSVSSSRKSGLLDTLATEQSTGPWVAFVLSLWYGVGCIHSLIVAGDSGNNVMRVVANSKTLTAILSALPFLYIAPLAVAHQSKFLATIATGVGAIAIFGNIIKTTRRWNHNQPTPASASAIACALGLCLFASLRRIGTRFRIDVSAPFEQPISLLCGSGFFLSILIRSSALYPSFRPRERPKAVNFLVRNGTMLLAVGATAIVGHKFDVPGLTSTARLFGTLWGLQKCAESFALGVPALFGLFGASLMGLKAAQWLRRNPVRCAVAGYLWLLDHVSAGYVSFGPHRALMKHRLPLLYF
eukprot:INCI9929.3.p1 GENE.INCI9929.3~~INCI9929.3.p1  ORF type:complete len:783 (+),score=96.00 INCI9929.3:324-2672(+)